jgi:hypothetical protein
VSREFSISGHDRLPERVGIEYVVGDARELSSTNEYDWVVAAYLLNLRPQPRRASSDLQRKRVLTKVGWPVRYGE